MRLIKMTEFVLEQNNKMFVLTSDRTYTFQEYAQTVILYARLLKQPLKYGMFKGKDKLFKSKKGVTIEKSNTVKGFTIYGHSYLFFAESGKWTIEDLTHHVEDYQFELTESAQKQIGV